MEHGTLDVAGVERGYWLARAEAARGPLLMVLHGSGTSGRDIATIFTGLATRGPAAGVTVVFPDGWGGVWHIARPPAGPPGLDDAAFLAALAGQLGPAPAVLAGISNGAGFAEHVARHGLLPLAGLFLVAGTLREFSRQACPVPRQQAPVTIMAGTADPMAPYHGGPLAAGAWWDGGSGGGPAGTATGRPSGGWRRWRRWPGTGPRATGSAASRP